MQLNVSFQITVWTLTSEPEYVAAQASLVAQMVKKRPEMQETRFGPHVRKIPWIRAWLHGEVHGITPVLLSGEFHRRA